jgi:glycerol-3-phosphate acyltransferase PlsX
MKIIMDAFGGDHAPLAVLRGAAQAVARFGKNILLVGDEARLRELAAAHQIPLNGLDFCNTPLAMPVEADAARILRDYRESSMAVGLKMLADGEGDAFISAGSTAALVMGGTMIVKRIKGIKRPAIATAIPNGAGHYLLIDSGANSECRPEMLLQFGLMGSVYMSRLMSVDSPRVAVINIGTEENKGNELQVEANRLLRAAPVNFVGNIEARDIPLGGCDVAVCDGFTGNVILKLSEGLAKMFTNELKSMFKRNALTKAAALAMSGGFREFKNKLDYSEHGGAMLLGLARPVIKAHGSSDARAFENAVRQAIGCCQARVIPEIEAGVAALRAETAAGETEDTHEH